MNFFEALKVCFIKYTTFSGRASRSEFWLYSLFLLIGYIIFGILDPVITGVPIFDYDAPIQPLSTVFWVATLLPGISVAARRLHDIDRSGWWLLICLTGIGLIFPLLYWYCKKGGEGDNRFGFNS